MTKTSPDNGHGHILNSLLLFGEVLRRAGLDVGSGNMLDMVRAMEHVPFGRKQDFRQAARCILVHRKQDLPLFDEAFEVFWRTPATRQITRDIKSLGEERRYRKPEVGPPPAGSELGSTDKGDGDAQPGDSIDLTQTYSAREVLRAKDFADFSPSEIADARRMMAELYWDLGSRRTRRLAPGGGASLDLRRTLRRNVKYGGEFVELAGQRRKDKPRPLVLICDVSGSMERYTRMLLHFIHSIARNSAGGMGNAQQIEAFLFATRLTRITRFLGHRSIDQAVTEVSRAVPDWAGGTRIGQAIKTFNFQWLRRVGSGGPVVLVISDGWDRGEPEVLGTGNVPAATELPPAYLAEPAAGVAGLRAADAGHPGRPSLRGRLSSRPQLEQLGGPGRPSEQPGAGTAAGTGLPRPRIRRSRAGTAAGGVPGNRSRYSADIPSSHVGQTAVNNSSGQWSAASDRSLTISHRSTPRHTGQGPNVAGT